MAEKILNTRIQLKYDSLQAWATANTLLKSGEVAIAYLPPKGNGLAPAAVSEAVLMKVGPGNFNDLPFVSALAADVYAWAKEASLTISKDGTGNVVSGIEWDADANGGKGGIKFTTASVATSEGLKEVQDDIAAIEKDIADNRTAWAKDDNTTYTFAKSTDGKGITITPSEGDANTITFAFLTQAEIEALNYLVAADITTGSANGTIAVEGTDVAVKGLQDAAYTTVTSLNTTAKGYADAVQNSLGDLATKDTITASLVTDLVSTVEGIKVLEAQDADQAVHAETAEQLDNAITVKVGGTDVVFDGSEAKTADVDSAISNAIGTRTTYTNTEIDNKVGEVLGTSADAATANTVYGAKAAAAAAQSDATTAKTKIEAFLGAITPEGTSEAIDTLAEIQKYMTDDTAAFTQLSTKVTNIENGATATTAGDLTAELEAEIKGYTVANATKAADADKLGGQDPSYYATAASVTDITKDGGAIDAALEAVTDTFGDIITHDASEFASSAENGANAAAQGAQQTINDYINAHKDDWTNDEIDSAIAGYVDPTVESLNSSVAATAEADNKVSVLTGVTQEEGTLTDHTEVTLAAIAKTGNVNDLVQTTGDVLVFNCGSASEVI